MSVSSSCARSVVVRRLLAAIMAVALVASLWRLILPLREHLRLRSLLSATCNRRAAQEALGPLYAEILNSHLTDPFAALVPPASVPVPKEDVAVVSTRFAELAQAHGFTLGTARLQVISEPPRRLLSVTLPMDGTYERFGALLKDILLLPSLESLDRVSVMLGETVDQFTVECKLAVADESLLNPDRDRGAP